MKTQKCKISNYKISQSQRSNVEHRKSNEQYRNNFVC